MSGLDLALQSCGCESIQYNIHFVLPPTEQIKGNGNESPSIKEASQRWKCWRHEVRSWRNKGEKSHIEATGQLL